MQNKLLSVIVPIYKQEKTVEADLKNIYETLEKTKQKFELIAVIDGTSLDNSFKNAKNLEKNSTYKNLKVIGYPTNKGKGQAIRYAMYHSKGEIVIFIDGGMDINPNGILTLIDEMQKHNADIVITSKFHPDSITNNYPLWRTKGYYYLVRILFGLNIHDTQTGLKAYKREVLDNVLDKLVVKSYAFDIEILAVAHAMGFTKMYEAPVEIEYNSVNSSLKFKELVSNKIVKDFLWETFAIWYRLKILRYYQDDVSRVKVYDEELEMYVNTGNMSNKKQRVIDVVNKLLSRG